VRRRQTAPAVAVPPELAHFELERWTGLVVVVEEAPGGTASPQLSAALAAHRAWSDARTRYADEHGWPTDIVDRLREQRAVRLRL
jgi:hypothetical protein